MKELIYLDITKSKDESLYDLQQSLKEFSKSKLASFIISELLARRDKVLFDDKKSAEFKEGALQQLIEVTDFLGGAGLQKLTQIALSKNKDFEKKPSLKKEDLLKEFNEKVLKTK